MNKSIGEINKNIEALMKMIDERDNKRGKEIIELANKLSIHAYMTDDSSQPGVSKNKVNKRATISGINESDSDSEEINITNESMK